MDTRARVRAWQADRVHPLVWVGVAVVALVGLDRVALWAERRGWIYWRRRRPSSGGGGAALALIDVFQPTRQVAVEEREWQDVRVAEADAPAPRDPGGARPSP